MRDVYKRQHDIAVFFSEQRHSAQLLGLLEGHHIDVYGQRLEDFGVDDPLHLSQLLGRYSVEVREVEAHTLVAVSYTHLDVYKRQV